MSVFSLRQRILKLKKKIKIKFKVLCCFCWGYVLFCLHAKFGVVYFFPKSIEILVLGRLGLLLLLQPATTTTTIILSAVRQAASKHQPPPSPSPPTRRHVNCRALDFKHQIRSLSLCKTFRNLKTRFLKSRLPRLLDFFEVFFLVYLIFCISIIVFFNRSFVSFTRSLAIAAHFRFVCLPVPLLSSSQSLCHPKSDFENFIQMAIKYSN